MKYAILKRITNQQKKLSICLMIIFQCYLMLNITHGKGLKILHPKQMFQRLPKALAQVKAFNASENLLNEVGPYIVCIEQKKLLKKA